MHQGIESKSHVSQGVRAVIPSYSHSNVEAEHMSYSIQESAPSLASTTIGTQDLSRAKRRLQSHEARQTEESNRQRRHDQSGLTDRTIGKHDAFLLCGLNHQFGLFLTKVRLLRRTANAEKSIESSDAIDVGSGTSRPAEIPPPASTRSLQIV